MTFFPENWRFFHWDVAETIEYRREVRYLKRVYTPVVSVGLEHSLSRPDRIEKLLPHSLVSPSLLADALRRRQEEVAPKVDEFFDYIHSIDTDGPSCSDKFQEAVQYAINQEDKLRQFLNDPEIPMQNAYAERQIRNTYCTGRNSWLFSYSMAGAAANAAVYSLKSTCIQNGHNPFTYLKYLGVCKTPEAA